MSYTVTIPRSDLDTLAWLSARGYDAGFYDLATRTDDEDEAGTDAVFTLTEPQAWEFSEAIDEDPDAFLACNGSETLGDALLGFWQRIV